MPPTMGREIRMVPPNWQHPEIKDDYGRLRLQPMYDQDFASAKAEWLEGLRAWDAGENDDREKYKHDDGRPYEYWEWHGNPPCPAYYRPWKDEEATWYQVWETVSEGTPVTPPFATQQELADYLAENGDEWDQSRSLDPHACKLFGITPGKPGWGKVRAEKFVFGGGWAPSFVVSGGQMMSGVEFVTQTADP